MLIGLHLYSMYIYIYDLTIYLNLSNQVLPEVQKKVGKKPGDLIVICGDQSAGNRGIITRGGVRLARLHQLHPASADWYEIL